MLTYSAQMTIQSVKLFYFMLLAAIITFGGCSNKQGNFNAISSFSRNYVNAVIEIPAGTNQRIKYIEMDGVFLVDRSGDDEGIIDFLPAPGNYGFVPGTFMDPVLGGDGEPVKIMVIAENMPTGTVLEVIPLLVMYFNENSGFGQNLVIPVIIATPASSRLQVINAFDYEDLFADYPEMVDILITWVASFRGQGSDELRAMGDGEVAINEIEKWEIRRQ